MTHRPIRMLARVATAGAALLLALTNVVPDANAGPLPTAPEFRGAVRATSDDYADPGFSYLDGMYRLYATGGRIRARSSFAPVSGYPVATQHLLLDSLPSWVDQSNPQMWAPHVEPWVDVPTGQVFYNLYFSAIPAAGHDVNQYGQRDADGQHCIGVAYSSHPDRGFVAMPEPALCAKTTFEAIDPTVFSYRGTRYLVYKSGRNDPGSLTNGRFSINAVALSTNGRGVRAGAARRTVLGGLTYNMEAPDLVRTPSGRLALFVSRGRWSNASYRTEVWTSGTMFGGWSRVVRKLTLRSRTGEGTCATGGAEVVKRGKRYFIAYHALQTPTGVCPTSGALPPDGSRRQAWVGELRWGGDVPSLM